MKVFISLVLGVIAIGLVLTVAAAAFLWPATDDVEALSLVEMGITDFTATPAEDRLGIQFSWIADTTETTTYVLQRTRNAEDDDWQEIVVVEPGSSHYVDEKTVRYLDEDVEHLVTYFYRVQMREPAGGSGFSETIAVTAVNPSR